MKRLVMGIAWNLSFVILNDAEPLSGQWISGKFPIKTWWTYDGSKAKEHPVQPSIAFHFFGNGDAEFFMATKTAKNNCIAEELVYKKGKYIMDNRNAAFIFYPAEGNYRNFYSCNPSYNINRSTISEEMHPVRFYWSVIKDKKGSNVLAIRFDPDLKSSVSYFRKSTW